MYTIRLTMNYEKNISKVSYLTPQPNKKIPRQSVCAGLPGNASHGSMAHCTKLVLEYAPTMRLMLERPAISRVRGFYKTLNRAVGRLLCVTVILCDEYLQSIRIWNQQANYFPLYYHSEIYLILFLSRTYHLSMFVPHYVSARVHACIGGLIAPKL